MKIWEKIKLFYNTKVLPFIKQKCLLLWEKIKILYFEKILPWLKKNWFEITNLTILILVHFMIRNVPETGFADFILKTWILGILVYYIWFKIKKYFI